MIFNNDLLGSVTVWYNPEPLFIENIRSYSGYSGLLIIVDNSASNNQHLFDKIESSNKIYIWNGVNMGIAKALNQGLQMLTAKNYKFGITLDQDSSFEKGEIEKLLLAAKNLDWQDVGILSPIHVQQKGIPVYNSNEYTPITAVMTSGNILNLAVAEKIGYFNERLFIDQVDNEFCLRLHKGGFKVLLANSFLIHELGEYKPVYFLGKKIGGFISHSPERLYFFTRNSTHVLTNYFFIDINFSRVEVTSMIKRFVKLFFEDNTKKRLGLYFKGIYDSRKLK